MSNVDGSLRHALKNRKTIRKFTGDKLSRKALDDLIWAAYGHTHTKKGIKMRTAPSPGAMYPIEIHCIIENVTGMKDGIYIFDRKKEALSLLKAGKFLELIQEVSLDQKFITQSNVLIIMVYNPRKITPHYGDHSFRYSAFECGHIAQNIILMATVLGLGSVPVGAFDERGIAFSLNMSGDKEILYFVAVGNIK